MKLPNFRKKKSQKINKTDQKPKQNQTEGSLYQAPPPTKTNIKPSVAKPAPKEKKESKFPKKPKIDDPFIELGRNKLHLVDIVSPQVMETDFSYFKIGKTFYRTLFVTGFPRFVSPGWLEPVINFNSSLNTAFYLYPVEGKSVLDDLRRKIAEMEA